MNIVEKRERIAGIRTLNMYCRLTKNSKNEVTQSTCLPKGWTVTSVLTLDSSFLNDFQNCLGFKNLKSFSARTSFVVTYVCVF